MKRAKLSLGLWNQVDLGLNFAFVISNVRLYVPKCLFLDTITMPSFHSIKNNNTTLKDFHTKYKNGDYLQIAVIFTICFFETGFLYAVLAVLELTV